MLKYTIVIETENLSMAESACLWECLDSVHAAISNVAPPAETLLLNSGDLSTEMASVLQRDYTWITLVAAPSVANYYEAKMHGIQLATGDIIILVDSDCSYNDDWLHGLLEPFKDKDVKIVAGETAFAGTGPYNLALAIAHSFDGYSTKSNLYPVNNYYANNVAFRRSLILELPIPTDLPLYRHGCSLHCVELRRRGETIWAQPRSRAAHAPPSGPVHFFWRFLLFGRDRSVRSRLGFIDNAPKFPGKNSSILHVVKRRLSRTLANQPEQWKWIPMASIIVFFAFILIKIGQALSRLNTQLAISHFGDIEGVHYPTVKEFKRSRHTANAS